jgi:hypothetical protein
VAGARSIHFLNKTRKVGLAKRRKRIAKLHAAVKNAPVAQKGPRTRKAVSPNVPTLALTPLPRR